MSVNMSVNLLHFLLTAAKTADPQRLLQTAINAVNIQHLGQHLSIFACLANIANVAPNALNLQHVLLSVTTAVDQQPLQWTAENAVNSQTCYDLARKLRLNRHPCAENINTK